MKDKHIIIVILILIAILFLYKYQENITSDSGKTLSDEALQTIASVYNTQNMIVTNLNATNQTLLKDTKISGDLNVSGTIIGNVTGNVTGNLTGNVSSNTINTNKININNNGFVIWTQQINWGRPQEVLATDPSGNTYPSDKWVLYSGGWGASGIGNCATFIRDNKWCLRIWATDHPTNNFLQVLAIPRGYFSNVFPMN